MAMVSSWSVGSIPWAQGMGSSGAQGVFEASPTLTLEAGRGLGW